jgi:hypothetical protein
VQGSDNGHLLNRQNREPDPKQSKKHPDEHDSDHDWPAFTTEIDVE